MADTTAVTTAPWKSKTLWANLLMAGAAFFPGVQEQIQAHPTILALVFAGVNMALRFLTKGAIVLE